MSSSLLVATHSYGYCYRLPFDPGPTKEEASLGAQHTSGTPLDLLRLAPLMLCICLVIVIDGHPVSSPMYLNLHILLTELINQNRRIISHMGI